MKLAKSPVRKTKKRAIWGGLFIFVIFLCITLPLIFPLSAPSLETGPNHYYVTLAGKKIHYVMVGSGRPMILLHSGGTSWHDWENIIPVLALNYAVYAPDMPGAGSSEELDGTHNIQSYKDFLGDFIDIICAPDEKVDLAGMSFGGMTALSYTLENPDRVNKLVLLEVAGTYTHPERKPILSVLSFVARNQLARETTKWWVYHLGKTGLFLPIDLEVGPDFARSSSRATIEILESWSQMEISSSELETIQTPVLLLVGENDREIPPFAVEQLAASIPNSKLLIVPGYDHTNFGKLNLGTGGIVDQTILDFFEEGD